MSVPLMKPASASIAPGRLAASQSPSCFSIGTRVSRMKPDSQSKAAPRTVVTISPSLAMAAWMAGMYGSIAVKTATAT